MIGERFGEVTLIVPKVGDQRCRICGAPRGKGEADAEWVVDVQPVLERRAMTVVRADDGTETATAMEPEWSRRHVACVPVLGWLLETVSGIGVVGLTEQDVRDVQAAVPVPLTAEGAGYSGRRPFGWLDDSARSRLVVEMEAARYRHRPQPDQHGRRCGLCGVGRSTEWSALVGWRWQDGVPASACSNCTAMLGAVRDPDDHPDRVRIMAISAAASMTPSPMLQPVAMRWKAACEVAAPTEYAAPDAKAWTYRREAVGRLAREAQERLPHLVADPRRRALAEARLSERYAAAEREAEQRRDEEEPERGLW